MKQPKIKKAPKTTRENVYLDSALNELAKRLGVPFETIAAAANKYGYSAMFGTPKSETEFQKYFDRACKAGHVPALIACVCMLHNYWIMRTLERDVAEGVIK